MESIKSIVNALKAGKKIKANQKAIKSTIKRWHTASVKKQELEKVYKSLKMNPEKFKGHPYIKYMGKK